MKNFWFSHIFSHRDGASSEDEEMGVERSMQNIRQDESGGSLDGVEPNTPPGSVHEDESLSAGHGTSNSAFIHTRDPKRPRKGAQRRPGDQATFSEEVGLARKLCSSLVDVELALRKDRCVAQFLFDLNSINQTKNLSILLF